MAIDYGDIRAASGLRPGQSDIIDELIRVQSNVLAKNDERLDYYKDKVPMVRIGVTIPETAPHVDVRTGWGAKVVNQLAARSILDGFSADNEAGEMLSSIVRGNRVSSKYDKALTSELIFGCSFWSVTADPVTKGAKIRLHDARQAAAVWSKDADRVRYGMVVEDYGHKGGNVKSVVVPTTVALHLEDCSVELHRTGDAWAARQMSNKAGRPLMVAMMYRPDEDHPFGYSRITRSVMSNIQAAMRERERAEYHSEFSATGSKYILGAADDLFEANSFRLGSSSMLLIGKDEDGDVPTMGQFAQQSISGHLDMLEYIARQMASETLLPLSSFGVMGNGYTSSDALRASSDDLIVEAEALNKTNGESLKAVAELALAVQQNKPLDRLTEDERNVTVSFRDPAMPSMAAMADSSVKIASVIGGYGDTDVCRERLGFTEDERRRMRSDERRAAALSVRDQLIAGQ